MRNYISVVLLAAASAAGSSVVAAAPAAAVAAPKHVPVPAGYKVVFEDLFDTPVASGLPSSKWDYHDAHKNEEVQSYVTDADNDGHVKVEPRMVDGKLRNVLVLRTAKADKPFKTTNWHAVGKELSWRGGAIQTRASGHPDGDYTNDPAKPRQGMPYGRYEIRVKLPSGKGSFPAAWLLGRINNEYPGFPNGKRGWPHAGELDIFEHLGREEASGYHVTHHTVHRSFEQNRWPTSNVTGNKRPLGFHHKSKVPWSRDWHLFRVDWFEDRIVWFVDGKMVNTVNLNVPGSSRHSEQIVNGLYRNDPRFDTSGPLGWPWDFEYNNNFHLIINMAVGSRWAGPPDPAIDEFELLVDYVRVYAPE